MLSHPTGDSRLQSHHKGQTHIGGKYSKKNSRAWKADQPGELSSKRRTMPGSTSLPERYWLLSTPICCLSPINYDKTEVQLFCYDFRHYVWHVLLITLYIQHRQRMMGIKLRIIYSLLLIIFAPFLQVSARYSRDPYNMLDQLKKMNLKHVKVEMI